MGIQHGLRITSISSYERKTKLEIPFYSAGVSAGSPSSADDPLEQSLDLNEYLIKHPIATFFVRVEGTSMIGAGIHSGDILIVDKALEIFGSEGYSKKSVVERICRDARILRIFEGPSEIQRIIIGRSLLKGVRTN